MCSDHRNSWHNTVVVESEYVIENDFSKSANSNLFPTNNRC